MFHESAESQTGVLEFVELLDLTVQSEQVPQSISSKLRPFLHSGLITADIYGLVVFSLWAVNRFFLEVSLGVSRWFSSRLF